MNFNDPSILIHNALFISGGGSCDGKSTGPGVIKPDFWSWLCHLPAVVTVGKSLNLSLPRLPCLEMRLMRPAVPTSQGCCEAEMRGHVKHFGAAEQ